MTYVDNKTAYQDLYSHLQVRGQERLRSFFVSRKSKIESLSVGMQRTAHFLRTGVWINETRLYEWEDSHPQQKLSTLFSGRRVQQKLLRHEQLLFVPKSSYWTCVMKSFGFIKEYVQKKEVVGALVPSTQYLAKEIVSQIPKDVSATRRRILEIGPGTGAFTDRIIRRMNPLDVLHLVEFDEKFCKQLQERYKNIHNVTIFHRSILDHSVSEEDRYDYVVSGLPLNSFPVRDVEKVFSTFERLLARGGKLSYFDYLFFPGIKQLYLKGENKENFAQILRIKDTFFNIHGTKTTTVWRNCTPARVRHHQMPRQ